MRTGVTASLESVRWSKLIGRHVHTQSFDGRLLLLLPWKRHLLSSKDVMGVLK